MSQHYGQCQHCGQPGAMNSPVHHHGTGYGPGGGTAGQYGPGGGYPGYYGDAPRSLDFLGSGFVKGALIGAVAAYLVTNEKVQDSVVKSVAKLWVTMEEGVEEVKERFKDAEAEIHSAHQK